MPACSTLGILFLVSRRYWETKMSRARFFQMQAVARHPRVGRFEMWGNGFDGYCSEQTLTDNLRSLDWAPDLIHVYKPDEHQGVAECRLPKVIDYNEAWWPGGRAVREVQRNGIDLVIHHHANDRRQFAAFDGPVVHLPHCAEASLLRPRPAVPLPARPVDCLVTGATSAEVYPLRSRLAALIRSGIVPGVVRPHPGYRLADHKACAGQFRAYAAQLAQAKIVLACTSRYRYPLAKLVEAMLAGCAVASDMPDDPLFRGTLGRHLIELDPQAGDGELAAILVDWLARPSDLEQLAAAGQSEALARYTCDHYAQGYLTAVSALFGRCEQAVSSRGIRAAEKRYGIMH